MPFSGMVNLGVKLNAISILAPDPVTGMANFFGPCYVFKMFRNFKYGIGMRHPDLCSGGHSLQQCIVGFDAGQACTAILPDL